MNTEAAKNYNPKLMKQGIFDDLTRPLTVASRLACYKALRMQGWRQTEAMVWMGAKTCRNAAYEVNLWKQEVMDMGQLPVYFDEVQEWVRHFNHGIPETQPFDDMRDMMLVKPDDWSKWNKLAWIFNGMVLDYGLPELMAYVDNNVSYRAGYYYTRQWVIGHGYWLYALSRFLEMLSLSIRLGSGFNDNRLLAGACAVS